MKGPVLFIIRAASQKEGRLLEALRVAAGVEGWGKVQVRVYLHFSPAQFEGAGKSTRGEVPWLLDRLQGWEGMEHPLYVPVGTARAAKAEDWPGPVREISERELAALAVASGSVLSF